MSQLMRLWYLSHRRPAKAQASLRGPELSLFAHMNYGSRRRVRPKIRDLAPLDVCACVFEEWIYGGKKVPKSHELAQIAVNTCICAPLLDKNSSDTLKTTIINLNLQIIWAASWQNQQNGMCALRRQISLASAQSDQSLHCPHQESLEP